MASISESFNQADGALGPDLTWTAVDGTWATFSNTAGVSALGAAGGNYREFARAEHDLASSDHYAQLTITTLAAFSTRRMGPTARCSSANQQCYIAGLMGDGNVQLAYNDSAGSDSVLATTAVTISLPQTVKIECNGNVIKVYVDGVEKISYTDSVNDLTANLRCGMCVGPNTSPRGDNFSAADLSSGNRRRRIFCMGA